MGPTKYALLEERSGPPKRKSPERVETDGGNLAGAVEDVELGEVVVGAEGEGMAAEDPVEVGGPFEGVLCEAGIGEVGAWSDSEVVAVSVEALTLTAGR